MEPVMDNTRPDPETSPRPIRCRCLGVHRLGRMQVILLLDQQTFTTYAKVSSIDDPEMALSCTIGDLLTLQEAIKQATSQSQLAQTLLPSHDATNPAPEHLDNTRS